jgi:hypothetical protein
MDGMFVTSCAASTALLHISSKHVHSYHFGQLIVDWFESQNLQYHQAIERATNSGNEVLGQMPPSSSAMLLKLTE